MSAVVPELYPQWEGVRAQFGPLMPYFAAEYARRGIMWDDLREFFRANKKRIHAALPEYNVDELIEAASKAIAGLNMDVTPFLSLDGNALDWIEHLNFDDAFIEIMGLTNIKEPVRKVEVPVDAPPVVPFKVGERKHLDPIDAEMASITEEQEKTIAQLEAYLRGLTEEQRRAFYRAFLFEVQWRTSADLSEIKRNDVIGVNWDFFEGYISFLEGAGVRPSDLIGLHGKEREQVKAKLDAYTDVYDAQALSPQGIEDAFVQGMFRYP